MTEQPFSKKITEIRTRMAVLRGDLEDIAKATEFERHAGDVRGLLTCGLVTLHFMESDARELEIRQTDTTRGPNLHFAPRGVGLDICPGCFVCGALVREPGANDYLHNVAAFVKSIVDADKIVAWFGGRARVDYRPSEPSWIQVKVGACTAHLPNLNMLVERTSEYSVIREADVVDALAVTSAPAESSWRAEDDE